MSQYIDGFVHPIPTSRLDDYKRVVVKVAEIWKEHGALDYCEYIGDDLHRESTRSFTEMVNVDNDETVLFGWVVFESKESRDRVNELVAADPRMTDLIQPLISESQPIFAAHRMAYGGFRTLFKKELDWD